MIVSRMRPEVRGGRTTNLIPAARRTDWSFTGVPGGIPERDVTPYATFTTASYSAAAINAAIIACGDAGGGVIYLAAGTYDVVGIQVHKSNVTLRGAGMGQTILRGATILYLGLGWENVVGINIVAGGAKDSHTFTVATTTGLSVNQMIELNRENDSDYVVPLYPGSGTRHLRQVNRITAIDGNVITVQNPLFIDFSVGTPKIDKTFASTSMSGVEDLTLDHSTVTEQGMTWFNYCYACWLLRVESKFASGFHFQILGTLNIEVRECYIHEAYSGGPNNAGLAFFGGQYGSCSSAKVEDNMFDKCFPAIEMQNSSSGTYIGYNYFHGSGQNPEGTGVTWTMMDNHGPHDMMNLWEGNVGEMFGSDGYFGGSSHGTAFRNHLTGVNPRGGIGNPIRLNRLSYYYNIIGNVLGSTGLGSTRYIETLNNCGDGNCIAIYRLGYPNIGNADLIDSTGYPVSGMTYPDAKVTSTLFRWGNYDHYTDGVRWESSEVPAGVSVPVGTSLPISYIYTEKPSWFGSVPWPPIGPDVTGGAGDSSGRVHKIPAQLRFAAL